MVPNPMEIGWHPTLTGLAVLLIAGVSGWGIAAQEHFVLVRGVRFWIENVIFRALRHPRWSIRTAVIFTNNACTCALMVWAGGWPAGSWAAVVVVGLSMGIAVRSLGSRSPAALPDADPQGIADGQGIADPQEIVDPQGIADSQGIDERDPEGLFETPPEHPPKVDGPAQLGLMLNLIEVPAILVSLGLSMGQLAVPNGLSTSEIWWNYVIWVLPALAVAGGGESLWIGRLRPFQ